MKVKADRDESSPYAAQQAAQDAAQKCKVCRMLELVYGHMSLRQVPLLGGVDAGERRRGERIWGMEMIRSGDFGGGKHILVNQYINQGRRMWFRKRLRSTESELEGHTASQTRLVL